MNASHPDETTSSMTARLGDRSLFPHLEARAYLNHGGISPASVPVQRAVSDLLEDYARRGASAFPRWREQRMRLKDKLGRLLNVSPGDIALTQNTTQGILNIALSFPWAPGDRVIVFDGEFPSNVTPWQGAAARFGCEVVLLPLSDYAESDEPGLDRLTRELERGARLVAVSAVEFQTGLRMPLRAIAERCHAHGAEVFVDGVQACGIVPLDARAEGIDYLACGSHKWMMGLDGAGFLYIHPDRIAKLVPTLAGWFSHEEGLRFLFEGKGHLRYDRPVRKSADFFEGGNVSGMGFAALEASLDLILSIGVPAIHEHVNRYNDALEAGLLERGFSTCRARDKARRSGTLSLDPLARGVSVVALHRALTDRGIACALPDGLLRFTPHWPNALTEIPIVLAALDESLSALDAS